MTTTPTAAARVSGTIKVCEFLRDTLPKHVTKNTTNGKHRLFLGGEVYEGPVVDWAHNILTGLSDMGANALAAIQPDHEPQPVAWQRRVKGRDLWQYIAPEEVYDQKLIGNEVRPLYATPSSAGTVSVVRYRLEWLAGARPPSHPDPMKGSASFDTQEDALAFLSRLADDAKPLSLTRTETITTRVDLPPALRALAGEGER